MDSFRTIFHIRFNIFDFCNCAPTIDEVIFVNNLDFFAVIAAVECMLRKREI